MKTTIVVARHGEDVGWTNQFENVIIYNKGLPLPEGVYKEIVLPNVGREGHTYYKHICDNYENLADLTVFLQGHPFDHSPNIVAKIKEIKPTTEFEFLSEKIFDTNLLGCRHHTGLPIGDVYTKLFERNPVDHDFWFGAGAQFVVSRDRILRRPKSFYSKIVEMLEKSVNPIEGFVIERLHTLIMSIKFLI